MKDGIYKNLSFEDYRKAEGINVHSLMDFAKCPAWYKYKQENPKEEATEAMLLGSAVDTMTFEPEKFPDEFFVMPQVDLRTKAGKEAKAASEVEAAGKRILTASQHETVLEMSASLHGDYRVQNLLHNCEFQVSLFYQGMKGRPDAIKQGAMIDLKTTQDASPREFRRSIFKFHYHNQAAYYIHLASALYLPVLDYFIIAVEKTPPYLVNVYRLGKNLLSLGQAENLRYLNELDRCKRLDYWPSYEQEEIEIKDDVGIMTVEW